MKKWYTLVVLLGSVFSAFSQFGEIAGRVVDETGEGLPIANVAIVDEAGKPTGKGTQTDFDGNYSIKPLAAGKYNVLFSYVGYQGVIKSGVAVSGDKTTSLDVKLKQGKELQEVVIVEKYRNPLIDPNSNSTKQTVTAEQIALMPTRNLNDIASTTAGVFQQDQGKGVNIKGGRGDAVVYFVDGVKVVGAAPNLPATAVEELTVITGGVPARYGDATSGVISITTKGPQNKYSISGEVQTSQFLDGYGYNLANILASGPIIKSKKSGKPILGFFLSFEYLRQQDPNPSAVGAWQVRSSLLDSLQQFPLRRKLTDRGFALNSEYVTFKDMVKVKARPNMAENNFRGTAKLDFRLTDNMFLTVGGTAEFRRYRDWVEEYTIFNSENNPLYDNLVYRVFGRFTHNIQGKQNAGEEGEKKKSSVIQNAFYTLQVDYEKNMTKYRDDTHGFNAFNYGYIGKFESRKAEIYQKDTFVAANGQQFLGYKFIDNVDTSVIFTPSDINKYGSNYTEQYYQLLGANRNSAGGYEVFGDFRAGFTENIDQIQQNFALINGQRSTLVNNIWFNTGRQFNGFGYQQEDGGGGDNEQYRARLEGSFDILKPGASSRNKHSITIGFEFEQRVSRRYSVNPLTLWSLARQLTNRHLSALDRSNPIFRIGGQEYSLDDPNRPEFYENDTIYFNRVYNAEGQSYFDKQLRRKLGLREDGSDLIDLFAISPDQLSLNMFSADELLNDGASLVTYYGFDPYGNKYSRQPSFNDFFTKKNADGEYERAIGAFRPIYAAGYIQDRFFLKDIVFDIGLRVDRYDANQKVLKDPYSLYDTYSAGEVSAINGREVVHPDGIGSNYKVYVNSLTSDNPTIVGYRDGDQWFDQYGNKLATGASLARGGVISPYLKNPNDNIKSDDFDPNSSFTDYKPQIVVMPRLQFQFDITDKAQFFAHYDVLAQRPPLRGIMDPTEYFFFQDNIGGTINNPNLKPQRTIDFQLGFKQRVSNTSALTISAFYREFRNMVQLRKIFFAYPKDYITYDNIDFGTTKGISLDFDLRRTGNISMSANYTLQFADGTGSSDRSQLNLVTNAGNAGITNLRAINPLNFDARHQFNVRFNYSYGSGEDYKGPVVGNKQILANTGLDIIFRARSGTPYTEQEFATPEGLNGTPGRPITKGTINGARLPWNFRLDLRLYRDFDFKVGKAEKEDDRRTFSLQVYLMLQNILNTQNPINVYRFTGNPNDDGYIFDPSAASAIQNAVSPQAFKDQYMARINSPANYSQPRTIRLGVLFNFY